MDKRKGKPSPKQLAARKKFAAIMKAGGFKNSTKKKSGKKKIVRGKRTSATPRRIIKSSKTRRNRGGSVSDINKTLLLDDISKLNLSLKKKSKLINCIGKRLKI